mmetsp:Transcript_21826/g.55562  ORF Transcript_21826/g.55562 Transcript_21826/m.55562 type:complete len:107 (+) Transcript_21826:1777-2097(+)|eukprot:CAMPEP_0202857106 /NCGR_PEP_ID=MMETSP1391-20130828/170_1 /ASSEMBLY_ACC=CAM_ASM_000867 /TAXON_ID=1034604 /ORGANISM="Chlamydomonas leiostraca, Strain SAG 11-49" /LENGTH=106 /DNA_ID=CAMNT_0049535865 /DNA_START=407 /DNA_END=727 /DNA_ORIENTATION=+
MAGLLANSGCFAVFLMFIYARIFAQPNITSELSDLKKQISSLNDTVKSFTKTFYDLQQQHSSLESRFTQDSDQTDKDIKDIRREYRELRDKVYDIDERVDRHRQMA